MASNTRSIVQRIQQREAGGGHSDSSAEWLTWCLGLITLTPSQQHGQKELAEIIKELVLDHGSLSDRLSKVVLKLFEGIDVGMSFEPPTIIEVACQIAEDLYKIETEESDLYHIPDCVGRFQYVLTSRRFGMYGFLSYTERDEDSENDHSE